MTLQSNSPRVHYPVRYARVMGERPRTWLGVSDDPRVAAVTVRTNDALGTFPKRGAPVLPVRLRSAERPGRDYARPHFHRAPCGHTVPCQPVRGQCPRLADRQRPVCGTPHCR